MPRIRTLEGAGWIFYISIFSSYISFYTCFLYLQVYEILLEYMVGLGNGAPSLRLGFRHQTMHFLYFRVDIQLCL